MVSSQYDDDDGDNDDDNDDDDNSDKNNNKATIRLICHQVASLVSGLLFYNDFRDRK